MMKKIFFLLLIPVVSFGQTYEDIISIDSEQQFFRIGIENGYEQVEHKSYKDEGIGLTVLALNPTYDDNRYIKDFNTSQTWLFTEKGKTIPMLALFRFSKDNLSEKRKYDNIFSVAKKKLKFKEVREDFSKYTVDENLDIGFKILDGWCYIKLIRDEDGVWK